MVVWLVEKNCAADFGTHAFFASILGVEIDVGFGTDTTNGVPVKLVEEVSMAETTNQPSKIPAERTPTTEAVDQQMKKAAEEIPVVEIFDIRPEKPASATQTVESEAQPSKKTAVSRFKYATRTRSGSTTTKK